MQRLKSNADQQRIVAHLVAIGVPEVEARIIAKKALIQRFAAGEKVAAIGSYRFAAHVVLSGRLRAARLDGAGEEIRPGGIVGELSLLGHKLYQVADVVAEEQSETIMIEAPSYRRIKNDVPGFQKLLDDAASARLESLHAADRERQKNMFEQYAAIDRALRERGLGLSIPVK